MSVKHLGKQTVRLSYPPSIAAAACVVGKKEGQGPLREWFDYISEDSYFGEKTWEKAESTMLRQCFSLACDKAKISPSSVDCLFAGDLLNQCTGSSFAMRDSGRPIFGLYGACSTMAESLSLAALAIDGGFADITAAMTSSHFCSVERQFRFPLEYGGVRTPTAQWTVTGAGALVLTAEGSGPYVTHVTAGKIVDAGITDANNMGAAMAPAAYDTIKTHFEDTGRNADYYDAIVTGDLGIVGHRIVKELFRKDGIELGPLYMDCGMLIFDAKAQDVHAGGSGCGCSAAVLCGHLLHNMTENRWPRLLFCATGALMSPTSAQQGESILGICHAVALEMQRGC
ncbi:MAG: stage V sporulation protein AD [Oscillospiraceae bacterium]|nr:stage V sporulation protein AD [Oscillospiraceae bacterium]